MSKTDKAAITILGAVKEFSIGSTQWMLNSGFFASDSSVIYKIKRSKISQALFGGIGMSSEFTYAF